MVQPGQPVSIIRVRGQSNNEETKQEVRMWVSGDDGECTGEVRSGELHCVEMKVPALKDQSPDRQVICWE